LRWPIFFLFAKYICLISGFTITLKQVTIYLDREECTTAHKLHHLIRMFQIVDERRSLQAKPQAGVDPCAAIELKLKIVSIVFRFNFLSVVYKTQIFE
jgi:hypothetical protein